MLFIGKNLKNSYLKTRGALSCLFVTNTICFKYNVMGTQKIKIFKEIVWIDEFLICLNVTSKII